MTEPGPSQSPEAEPSREDLAKSFLNHQRFETKREIDSLEFNLNFARNYTPRSVVPRPAGIEPGSMDWSDWNIAELEDEEWFNGGQDAEIERLGWELSGVDGAYDRMSDILGLEKEVNEGNEGLITHYAELEIQRRKKLEEEKRARESRQAV